MDFLEQTFYGNTVLEWLIAAGIMVSAAIAGKLLYWIFGNVAKKLTARTKTQFDDIVIDMVEEPAAFVAFLAGTWYALHRLSFGEGAREFIGHVFQFVIIMTASWMLVRLFDALFKEYLEPLAEKTETDLDDQLLPIVNKGTKLTIWVVGLIIALNNAGYDVAAALAGLGIGGLALAMAGRDTVANMFGGLTIFVDQPFKLNDRVKVDGFDGTVKEIGLRSTRLETLEGRIVTIPNARFSENSVENVSAEPARKVVSTIGLTYDMKASQMKEAMETLRAIAVGHGGVEDDTVLVAFTGFGDFSMNIWFAYWIRKDADILDVQTEVNLAILDEFTKKGLDMAFPTQTLIHQNTTATPGPSNGAGTASHASA
jgi:MscS family membrane protein